MVHGKCKPVSYSEDRTIMYTCGSYVRECEKDIATSKPLGEKEKERSMYVYIQRAYSHNFYAM